MPRTLTALAAILLLSACGGESPATDARTGGPAAASTDTPAAEQTETQRLNAWLDAEYEEYLQFSPMTLTQLGRKDQNNKLDDFSIAAADQQLAWRRASMAEMQETFDYAALTPTGQISYDMWAYQLERAEADADWRYHGYIFEQMGGAQSWLPNFIINFHRVETEDDMLAYIERITEMGRAINQMLDITKTSAEKGIRPPAFAYEGALEQARKVVSGDPFGGEGASALWDDVNAELAKLVDTETITTERADELRDLARAALVGPFKAAYDDLILWLETDMANTGPEDGVWKLPDGEAFYNYRLASNTTTDLTADQVHQIGHEEVARLRGEMLAIKDEVGFEGSLADFFVLIRDSKDDPRFYYPDTDEGRQAYIDDATAAIENINTQLPNYFGILPKADLVVRRVEPFRERDGAAQHYFPGTPDGSRPGIYYAHLSDMTAMPKNQLEVIAYHEGNPGHHMQISIAQELTGVPQFRTQSFVTAYVEGWALYTELLAKEIPGTYQDPISDFGRLTTEMWRAVRLVVDTGIHSKQWTRQEAIDYFAANTPEPLESIEAEIERYITWPGQATSYKIGMIKILELRERAKTELGEAFDIRAFHDTVLGGGGVPLAILERQVDDWIASVKADMPAETTDTEAE